jgi:hypothetical protein
MRFLLKLKAWFIRFKYRDIPDDVCCCGDDMKNHSSPFLCGHTPKSMRVWAIECDERNKSEG